MRLAAGAVCMAPIAPAGQPANAQDRLPARCRLYASNMMHALWLQQGRPLAAVQTRLPLPLAPELRRALQWALQDACDLFQAISDFPDESRRLAGHSWRDRQGEGGAGSARDGPNVLGLLQSWVPPGKHKMRTHQYDVVSSCDGKTLSTTVVHSS